MAAEKDKVHKPISSVGKLRKKPDTSVGGQASSLRNLEATDTLSLLNNPYLKATHRDFPHWQLEGRVYFVTFSAYDRIIFPDAQRKTILDAVKHWNRTRIKLHQAVVMPDHVHALIEPKDGENLFKVLHSVKSFSANKVNKALGRSGHLWQPESFDRIVRNREDYLQKWDYIRNNPVKEKLCATPEDYRWLYEDIVLFKCSLEGCPPTE